MRFNLFNFCDGHILFFPCFVFLIHLKNIYWIELLIVSMSPFYVVFVSRSRRTKSDRFEKHDLTNRRISLSDFGLINLLLSLNMFHV